MVWGVTGFFQSVLLNFKMHRKDVSSVSGLMFEILGLSFVISISEIELSDLSINLKKIYNIIYLLKSWNDTETSVARLN